MGQAVAALGAAAGEYLASIGGSHPLAEAVFFGALALFGLIGTEHLHTPPSSLCLLRGAASLLDGGETDFPSAVDSSWLVPRRDLPV